MLVQLGRSRSEPGDLVSMLLACHTRIRSFAALALAASQAHNQPEQEAVEACHAVARYFREALPLHVQDEERSIIPRLLGQSRDLDVVSATMQEEHAAHVPILAELLAACAGLCTRPQTQHSRDRLAVVARQVAREFDGHLRLEERLLFPAVARLAPQVKSELMAELRARRQSVGAP
jgi:iron-sulfur cluster repair protein YtfE (RIC family)